MGGGENRDLVIMRGKGIDFKIDMLQYCLIVFLKGNISFSGCDDKLNSEWTAVQNTIT